MYLYVINSKFYHPNEQCITTDRLSLDYTRYAEYVVVISENNITYLKNRSRGTADPKLTPDELEQLPFLLMKARHIT